MADQIGRVPVPVPVQSGATFRLVSEYGYGMSQDWKICEHRFGEQATMAIQRYGVGSGARRFHFVKSSLSYLDRQYLLDFYNQVQGSYASFTYPVPNTNRSSFTNVEVVFDTAPLSFTELVNRTQTGLTFVEIVNLADTPTGTVSAVCSRFPSEALAQALASEVQEIIPLIRIKVRNPAVPDIYLSDRRVEITGFPGTTVPTTFLPRLQGVGVPGTADVIMSQSIDGRADNVRFIFGNADRTMSALVNDCSIEYAQIDMSFFHVGTGILLELWKGVIISWQIDGSPQMSVQCSDGLYPITQSYPSRTISRQCWKPFNKDVVPGYRPCPWSTAPGHVGNAASCDYFFNSPNGCLSHGMSNYFGGHPEQPQLVVLRDIHSGSPLLGDFINSTSILSDSIWGKPLPEIWCNSFGSPQRAFWAECEIAAVRDEREYMALLGIVGVGPIGAFEGMSVQTNSDGYKFVVAPTADGFFPQGFKVDSSLNIKDYQPTLGLRQSVGNDPARLGQTPREGQDAFSLGDGNPQTWTEFDANFDNLGNYGLPQTVIPYAAGTALCEMRYPKTRDPGGLTPTTAESHRMQCPIRLGLTASTFDASGVHKAVPGCVNPFWVAANTYFRALGIQEADAATKLSHLALSSITNASGLGCADIAGLWADPIVGTAIPSYEVTPAGETLNHYNLDYYNGTFSYSGDEEGAYTQTMTLAAAQTAGYIRLISDQEPQFMFQGTVAQFKPFRDWMTEILNCSLGYYCFEFGKLRMGIRYSAVPTDSFTVGSMLYQSLSLTPVPAQFEYLKVSFGNVQLQYQQDVAEYEDKDHAIYFGRGSAPLTSSMRSVGCSTLSQGLRIAVTRTREEVGGILRADITANPYVEWDNHKSVTFKSTLLALNNEIGDVISITHPDLPTYPGAAPGSRPGSNGPMPAHTWPFRIQQWTLHSDWSVTITANSCVDSMYDLEVGPQPQGVGPRPLPVMFFPEPLVQWAPHQVQADAADALYPGEWTFSLQQTFQYQGDGVLLTSAVAGGRLPVNQFIPDCGVPDVKKGSVAWATTGGTIPGGTTLFVQLCAAITTAGAVQQLSPPSEVLVLQVPVGTDTNLLKIQKIKWPPVAGLNSWVLFANTIEDLLCEQQSGIGQPDEITFLGPVARQTTAVPDVDLHILRLRAQVLIHGGVLGAGVDSLTTSTIVSHATIDVAGTDNWAGRVLAIIGRQAGSGIAPFAHFKITAFDPATGTYTLDRDPIAAGVLAGDIFVVCFLGADNSANPYVVGDPGLDNGNNVVAHSGETVNDPNRIGRMVRVIAGTSRGRSAKIVSNTATAYTLDQPLPIDATSVWIVADPGWNYSKDVIVNNADPSKSTLSAIEINNYKGLALLVEGVTIDNTGRVVDDANACVRMLYIPGVQGTTNVTA